MVTNKLLCIRNKSNLLKENSSHLKITQSKTALMKVEKRRRYDYFYGYGNQ